MDKVLGGIFRDRASEIAFRDVINALLISRSENVSGE